MTIRFEPLADRHIPDAAVIAHEGYLRELRHVPALETHGVEDLLRSAIAELVREGTGVAAVDGGQLLGYMGFLGPIPDFFGSGTGCYSPLHGSGVDGNDRSRLSSLLFQHAAAAMVEQGVDTFAITAWHHDDAVIDALALDGFGMRCTDAIRTTEPLPDVASVPGITYRELSWEDAGPLLPLTNGLIRHLRQSPTFLTVPEYNAESFGERLEQRRTQYVVAFDGGSLIGYLEVCNDGENVLTTAPDMRNICGAFVAERYRGRGVSQGLLAVTLATLREEGIRRVGVDFETMNPTALHFWTKIFDRYTTSLARRIDVA